MTKAKKKRIKLFPNVKTQVFVQFVLIFLVILSVILFSSSSFYTSMMQILNMFSMRNATEELSEIDMNSHDALDLIADFEKRHGLFVEIYAKAERDSVDYTEPVYAKCYHGVLWGNTEGIDFTEDFEPIVDYANADFEQLKFHNDGSSSGIAENKSTGVKHFVLATPDSNKEAIYVVAIRHALIEGQAQSIAVSAIVITAIIFVAVTIATYFYITQITKPLNNIINVTKIMADEKDKNTRIPERDSFIKTGTDDAITNINMLYEELMLTQESLLEKSEILASQLEKKELEQKSRVEFIAGTSHELKTPISIIQGYAEGIKYLLNDKKATEEYCDTIIEECGRMNNLVVNMMSLAQMQQILNLQVSDFCINDFIGEHLEHHRNIFEKNGITVKNEIKEKFYGSADISKLQFVINNLLSNAISYIGGKNKIIIVSCEETGASHRISIYNSGEHIEQGNLQKLWDSFFRQDNARSRSDGHFGLGLSIVKAVQDAHSQQCGVENEDGGVRFWFDVAKGKEV